MPGSLSAEQDLAPGVLSSSLAQGQVLEGLWAGGGEEPAGPPTDDTFLQETQELLLKILGTFCHTVFILACSGKMSVGTMSKMTLISL